MGKILNKKQILMLVLTAVCIMIAVPVRVLLLVQNTEKANGFYNENTFWVWLLYGVCFVAVITPLLYNIKLSHRITPFGKSRSRAISLTGIVFAVAMLYDFINQTVTLFNFVSSVDGAGGWQGFYTNGGIPMVFQAVFAIVGGFYIMIYAFSFFGGTLNYRQFKMIALFPAVWLACRLIRHFMVEINYLFVSQRLLEMLMLILAVVFFFQLAKLNASFPDGVRNWKLFGTGWGCVFLCALLTLPRLALQLFGKSGMLPEIETAELVDLVMGAFILMCLLKGSVVPMKEKAPQKAEQTK